MLENYLNQKVQVFLEIGGEKIIYTGYILSEQKTHFEFQDKFKQKLLISKEALIQIKKVEK